jgi:ribonuclease HI
MTVKNVICFGDGSCRNTKAGEKNPMGVGVVIYTPDGEKIELSEYAGLGTSNLAEWAALILAFRTVVKLTAKYDTPTVITYKTDSQLIANMVNDIYSHRNFIGEYIRAKFWEGKLKNNQRLDVIWIPRTDNSEADRLSRKGNPYYKVSQHIK